MDIARLLWKHQVTLVHTFFFFLNQRNSLCLCQIFVGGFTMKTINFVFLTFFAGLTLCQYSLVDDGMDFDF